MTSIAGVLLRVVAIQAAVIAALLVRQTRRSRAERGLRESERRFRLMADRAPVMIWTARTDTRLDFLNNTCVEFTGLPIEQLLDEGRLNALDSGVPRYEADGRFAGYTGCPSLTVRQRDVL